MPTTVAEPQKLCNQEQAAALKRGVSRDMAESAGHQKKPLLKIIRAKCLECCGGSRHEVSLCSLTDCPNWPYRFGKNPFSTRKGRPGGNPEALRRAREARMAAVSSSGDTS